MFSFSWFAESSSPIRPSCVTLFGSAIEKSDPSLIITALQQYSPHHGSQLSATPVDIRYTVDKAKDEVHLLLLPGDAGGNDGCEQ